MPRSIPVWGFPNSYNPNLMGDRCEICHRFECWVSRPVPGQDFTAWTCAACTRLPKTNEIPLD